MDHGTYIFFPYSVRQNAFFIGEQNQRFENVAVCKFQNIKKAPSAAAALDGLVQEEYTNFMFHI